MWSEWVSSDDDDDEIVKNSMLSSKWFSVSVILPEIFIIN